MNWPGKALSIERLAGKIEAMAYAGAIHAFRKSGERGKGEQ